MVFELSFEVSLDGSAVSSLVGESVVGLLPESLVPSYVFSEFELVLLFVLPLEVLPSEVVLESVVSPFFSIEEELLFEEVSPSVVSLSVSPSSVVSDDVSLPLSTGLMISSSSGISSKNSSKHYSNSVTENIDVRASLIQLAKVSRRSP